MIRGGDALAGQLAGRGSMHISRPRRKRNSVAGLQRASDGIWRETVRIIRRGAALAAGSAAMLAARTIDRKTMHCFAL